MLEVNRWGSLFLRGKFMDTKIKIRTKIDNLEEAAKLMLEEIMQLKYVLEETSNGLDKKEGGK